MASIPESLTCLKRASLQRLCKRIGVKANGKVRFLPNTKLVMSHSYVCILFCRIQT